MRDGGGFARAGRGRGWKKFPPKELELTANEMVRWDAVREEVMSSDKTSRKRTAEVDVTAGIHETYLAAPKTAPEKNKTRKREKDGRGSSSSDATSSRRLSRPKVDVG